MSDGMKRIDRSLPIDRNRGTIEMTTPNGIRVIEFADEPGAWYDVTGKPVSEEVAASAGFDCLAGRKEHKKRELLAEARKKIEKQVDAEVERELREEFPDNPDSGPTAELQRVHRGGGIYRVEDGQGSVLLEKATKDEADSFIEEYGG